MTRLALIALVMMTAACGSGSNDDNAEEKIIVVEVDTAALEAQNEQLPSPRRSVSGSVANTEVTVDWGSPAVRDRVIWGELVPYGEIWRAGANENTTFEFSSNIQVANESLEAGKYGFFIIPAEDQDWTVVFSSKNDAWGHFEYSQAEDALRIDLTPTSSESFRERLVYEIVPGGVRFAWADKELLIPITA